MEDIFDLQDQITDRVVGIVEPSLQRSEIERSRRKRPENLDAHDLVMRAMPFVFRQMPDDAEIAMPLFLSALQLDPDYAVAHAHLAWCHEWRFSRAGFDEADRIAGLRHAHATVASGTDDATALAVAGFVIALLGKDYQTAIKAINRALSLNASCATALYVGSITHAFSGHPTEATTFAKRALRLSPFDQLAFQAHASVGIAAIQEGQYEAASSHFSEAVQANPGMKQHAILSGLCVGVGWASERGATGGCAGSGNRTKLYDANVLRVWDGARTRERTRGGRAVAGIA